PRETYLLVPFLFALKDRGYIMPIIMWLAWTGLVWVRFGAWGPTATLNGTHLLVPPFVGFLHALHGLQSLVLTLGCIVAIPALLLATLNFRKRDSLTPI